MMTWHYKWESWENWHDTLRIVRKGRNVFHSWPHPLTRKYVSNSSTVNWIQSKLISRELIKETVVNCFIFLVVAWGRRHKMPAAVPTFEIRHFNKTKELLTLAPIWLPHCPAWICTISLILFYVNLFYLVTIKFVFLLRTHHVLSWSLEE